MNHRNYILISCIVFLALSFTLSSCGSSGGGGGGGQIPSDVFLVDITGDGTDGKSWATAFNTIQEAVDAAFADGGGAVWVAAGTYTSGGTTSSVVVMADAVDIYGGFEGYDSGTGAAEKSLDLADSSLNKTVLNGMGTSIHVVTGADDAVFDGFYIIGGDGTPYMFPDNMGAGMYNDGVTGLTVSDCVFQGNASGLGGGAANANDPEVTMIRCTFISNSSTGGNGGGALVNYMTMGGTVLIQNCDFLSNTSEAGGLAGGVLNYFSNAECGACFFAGNSAESSGGAVYNNDGSAVFTDCLFSSNSSSGGAAGAVYNDSGTPRLTGCIFSGNNATFEGGAVYNSGTDVEISGCSFTMNTTGGGGGAMNNDNCSAVEIRSTIFIQNSAASSNGGGAVYSDTTPDEFIDCVFTANSASNAGSSMGGAFCGLGDAGRVFSGCSFENNYAGYTGGALMLSDALPCTIINCRFIANRAIGVGGAVALFFNGTYTIVNSLLAGNLGMSGSAGGIYVHLSDADIINCTITGNLAAAGGGGVFNDQSTLNFFNTVIERNYADSGSSQVADSSPVATTFYYSNISGSNGSGGSWVTALGIDGGGNIDSSTLFEHAPEAWKYNISTGTTVTVPVTDASSFAAVDDVIEIGNDGVVRTVTAVTVSEITFTPAYSENVPAYSVLANWGPGVTDAAPDFTPAAGSPGIDAADNTAVPADTLDLDEDFDTAEQVPVDLAGNSRFTDDSSAADTGNGTAPIADMGALERE